MEWRPTGWSVCLPPLHHKVQKFSFGTGSPGWSRKKGRKTVVVCVCVWFWAVLCATFVHSAMHTRMNRPNSCLLVRSRFFLWLCCVLQFICVRFGFWRLFCVVVCLCFCCIRFVFCSTTPRDWLGRTSPK